MKQIILILLIILSCALPLGAQVKPEAKSTKCALGIEQAPELRGFRLGTPQASVLARFPGASLAKPDKFGLAQLRLTIIDSGATRLLAGKGVQPDITVASAQESGFIVDSAKFPELKGVRRARLRFFEGRLANVEVAYDDSIKWDGADDFVQTVARTLNLPGQWAAPVESDRADLVKELRCDGFVITGDVGSDPTDTRIAAQLSVEDLGASKTLEKRQKDEQERAQREEEAKRKNFRP